MHIEIYTDGSATTNDKPGGWAWVMVVDGVKHSEGSGHIPFASNNDAELEAALQGISNARRVFGFPPEGWKMPEFTLVSDSQLVLGWVSGRYAFRQVEKINLFHTLKLLVEIMNLKTRWVEGHTGDEHNERCDELANIARTGEARKTRKKNSIDKKLLRKIIKESPTPQTALDTIAALLDN